MGMDEVRFEDQGEEFGRPPERKSFDLTAKIIQWGLASNRQQAEYILMAIGVGALVLALVVYAM
jgi:hypothetical protein